MKSKKKGFKNLKVVDPSNHTSRIDKTPVEVEDLNPFPYIFKTKFDFNFENNYEKIYENMALAKKLMQEDEQYSKQLADSKYFRDGALSTSHLNGSFINDQKYNPPHTWPQLSEFSKSFLPKVIGRIWDLWSLEKTAKPFIGESWINCHPKGASVGPHHHQGVEIAIACYLDVPENGGRLMVKSPLEIYNYAMPMDNCFAIEDGRRWRYIDVETNDVILFPGWLHHMTEPNRNINGEERWMMSANVYGAVFHHDGYNITKL